MLLFHSLFSMLSSTLLALSLFYAAPPECSGGTAWVDSVSDPPAMLQQAKCDGCKAVCDKVGTKSEGWYSSCDGSLIEWTMCGTREPVACTMDAKVCPDGVTYVGRDGSNNCEWQKCPSEGACTQEECGPAMGMPSRQCPDGSTAGPVCSRDSETGKCGYHIEECRMVEPPNCSPYVCADGTKVDACTEDGTVINYFAEPCLTHGGEREAGFLDVEMQHQNAEAITYVKEQGIVQGYEDGTYKPDASINRAEFVKILVAVDWKTAYEGMTYDEVLAETQAGRDTDCLKNSHDANQAPIFIYDDMGREDAWYLRPVCQATASRWIEGYPDGTFRPGNSINFVEAAKIIVKAFGLEATSTIPACEGDCPWYRDYVLMLEMRGAIPMSVTTFDQSITRGEMAEMIYRLKTGNSDKPSKMYDELAGGGSSSSGMVTDDSCTETYASTGVCPAATCIMDCADRDNPPKEGLGCPPGCFAKPR